jgi:hypothetical protein
VSDGAVKLGRKKNCKYMGYFISLANAGPDKNGAIRGKPIRAFLGVFIVMFSSFAILDVLYMRKVSLGSMVVAVIQISIL